MRRLLVCHVAGVVPLHEALDGPGVPEAGPCRGQLGEDDQDRHAVLADLVISVVGEVDLHLSCRHHLIIEQHYFTLLPSFILLTFSATSMSHP